MKRLYTSIDLGSDSVKIVVCELFKNRLNLLATSSVKSQGIKKGLITDIEKAKESIIKAIQEIEEMLGIKIKKVITSIPSYFADFKIVSSTLNYSQEESVEKIDGDDIVNLLKQSVENNIPSGNELISVIPIDFKVNNETVNDPKDYYKINFSLRAVMITTPKKNVYSVVGLLESVGLEVVDISIDAIGDVNTFKNKSVNKGLGAVVNIGHDKTTISIFNKGIVIKNSIIGFAGKNIEKDLALIYKIELKEARKIKEKFAFAHKLYASVNDFYEITNKLNEKIKINQFEASEIVMARLETILNLIKDEINVLTKREIDYIIFTGGTSMMEHMQLIADEIFKKKVTIGNIKILGARHNKYSSCIGNIVYFISRLKLTGKEYSMIDKEDAKEISSTKKSILNLSNESMLGKVFGYFFNE